MKRNVLLAFTALLLPILTGAGQCAVQRNLQFTLPAWSIAHSGPVGLNHEVIMSDGTTYAATMVTNREWSATVSQMVFDPATYTFYHVGLLPQGGGGWGYFIGDPEASPKIAVIAPDGTVGPSTTACPTADGLYAYTLNTDGSITTPDTLCVPQPTFNYTVSGYNHPGCTLYIRLGHVIQFGPIGLTPGNESYTVEVRESINFMEGSYITNPTETFWFEEHCGSGGLSRFDQSLLIVHANGTLIPLGADAYYHFIYDPETESVHL